MPPCDQDSSIEQECGGVLKAARGHVASGHERPWGLRPGYASQEQWKNKIRLHGFGKNDYFTAMLTGAPGIQAELIWTVAVPAPVPGGTRKFT